MKQPTYAILCSECQTKLRKFIFGLFVALGRVSKTMRRRAVASVFMAAVDNDVSRLRELALRLGTDVRDDDGSTLLWVASVCGNADSVCLLLSIGADPRVLSGPTRTRPLTVAALNCHFKVMRCLVAAGADPLEPDADGFTPVERVMDEVSRDSSFQPRHPSKTMRLSMAAEMKSLTEARELDFSTPSFGRGFVRSKVSHVRI